MQNLLRYSTVLTMAGFFLAAPYLMASADPNATETKAQHGEWVIRNEPLSVPLLKVQDFMNIWKVWEDKTEQDSAQVLQGDELLAAIGKHYGLFKADYQNNGLPLGLIESPVPNNAGGSDKYIAINCFFCHASQINKQTIWGAWNITADYQMLAIDSIRLTEKNTGLPKDTLVKGLPLKFSQMAGHFNLIKALGITASVRDGNMHLRLPKDLDKVLALTPADENAQPWWNTRLKQRMFWDGWVSSAAELHSSDLMGVVAAIGGGNTGVPQKMIALPQPLIIKTLSDVADTYAYHMSVPTPKYPFPIDQELAKKGEYIFHNKDLANGTTCANCHGDHELNTFPDLFISPVSVGTDPTRFKNMPQVFLDWYKGIPSTLIRTGAGVQTCQEVYQVPRLDNVLDGFADWYLGAPSNILSDIYNGDVPSDLLEKDANGHICHVNVGQKGGYQAPPLNGIWAAAPYFHNGSIPTLRDVLRPDERPKVWKIVDTADDMYDTKNVGLKVDRLTSVPDAEGLTDWARRKYYDSTRPEEITGAGTQGHTFAKDMSEDEVIALLEYLKTI